jgi:hypothetical protein
MDYPEHRGMADLRSRNLRFFTDQPKGFLVRTMAQDTFQQDLRNVMATPESVQGIWLVWLIMGASIFCAVAAVLSFLFTMTFFRVPEKHRHMGLGRVWLILVPFFGVYWLYVTTQSLAKSFQSYFAEVAHDDPLKSPPRGDYGAKMGKWMAIAAALTHVSGVLLYANPSFPMSIGVGILAGSVLVISVIYFAQVFQVRKLIPDPELEIVPESYL